MTLKIGFEMTSKAPALKTKILLTPPFGKGGNDSELKPLGKAILSS